MLGGFDEVREGLKKGLVGTLFWIGVEFGWFG